MDGEHFNVFKFIRISVDGEIIENDKKTIVWTENILFVFKFMRISVDGEITENDKKTIVWTENILTFSNLSGLVWTVKLLKTIGKR